MRWKYVEEAFPRFFRSGGEIYIGFNSNREDSVEETSKALFNFLDKEHNLVIDRLCEMACAWDESDHEAFEKFWYKKE